MVFMLKATFKICILFKYFFQAFFELMAAVRWYISSFPPRQNGDEDDRWTYFFIVETSSLIIPLISLIFPVFWFISNAFGNALLLGRYSFPVRVDCIIENSSLNMSFELFIPYVLRFKSGATFKIRIF